MGSASPRNSTDMIAASAEGAKSIQPHLDYWTYLQRIKFHDTYYASMLQAGIPQSKAEEIREVIRIHITRIADSLETATYAMREIIGEVADIRGKARTGQTGDARFKI